jgi:chaperonin GroES
MNNTGIFPSGNRVVVKPDSIEKTSEGGIIIAESIIERHQHAQSTGMLVALGPDAFCHTTATTERLIDGQWKAVERTRTGYSEAFAEVGERIAFAKYGGLKVEGSDGEDYRILNDEDITCRISDEVSFTDIESRKRVGLI